MRDLRFAARVLARQPLFTLLAALSLGLGIGANSAIFSLVDSMWFRPMALPLHPGEIVRVFSTTEQDPEGLLSYPEFRDLQAQATTLSHVVAYGGRGAMFAEGNTRRLVTLNMVSPNFFTALGVKPALGRLFTPQDEGGGVSVVLGYSFWQRHCGGDPNIVGRQLHIQRANDLLVTVIGVLPRSFREIDVGEDRDLWFSESAWSRLGEARELVEYGNRWFRVVARLAPAASVSSARAQVMALAERMAATHPDTNRMHRANVVSDLDYRLEQAGSTGLALMGVVLLVILISSVNVANLLLARAGARGTEMAVRQSLGAHRGRLMRQLMTENLLLGGLGLVFGLGIGALLIASLPSLMVPPPGFDYQIEFLFDARVAEFCLAVAMATVLLFGFAPAWTSLRLDLVSVLKGEAAFGPSGRRGWPLRNWLVVAQVAVSLTLLAGAGVLVRSFANTRTVDLGFGRKQLLLVWVAADDAKPALYRDIVSRFEALPGVRSVAMAVRAPLSLSSNLMNKKVTIGDRPEAEIKYNAVTANFLSTMGTPIVYGRGFEAADEAPGANSVLINECLRDRYWPHEDPIGKLIRGRRQTWRVVGVVKNAPINAVGELPEPYLYIPYWANFEEEATFLVETAGEAGALIATARRVLKEVRADIDPLGITTENELIRFSASRYQVTAELVGALGLLGLLLTAVGLYGVVSYNVSRRTREFGIRMALGADRSRVQGRVLGEVARMALAGLALGLPLALAGTRLMASLLFGVGPWDVPTFIGAGVVLAGVLLVANFVPARRATGIEPAAALRIM